MKKLMRCQQCGGHPATPIQSSYVICTVCGLRHTQPHWNLEMQVLRAKKRFKLYSSTLKGGMLPIKSNIDHILNELYGKIDDD